jgi:hypothetical protein
MANQFTYEVRDHMGRKKLDESGRTMAIAADNIKEARRIMNERTRRGGDWFGKVSSYYCTLAREYCNGGVYGSSGHTTIG